MNDQATAIDSIQTRIAQTAAWRRRLCGSYPEDSRNQPAADRLEALATDTSAIREGTWGAIEPHVKSKVFDDILNATSREVGFRHRPKNLNGFLVLIADKIDTRIGGAL